MQSTEIPEEQKEYTTQMSKVFLIVLCILMIYEIVSGHSLL
jgi:hypothetical protein